MGHPGEEGRDQLHREDLELEEEEEVDEELAEDYDDLIGHSVDNSSVAGSAGAARAVRGTQEMEPEQLEEMFNVIEERDFIGAPAAVADNTVRDHSTADEDEESGPPMAAPPPDEEEDGQAIPGAMQGDRWSADGSDTLAAPAPAELFTGNSDWVKED